MSRPLAQARGVDTLEKVHWTFSFTIAYGDANVPDGSAFMSRPLA